MTRKALAPKPAVHGRKHHFLVAAQILFNMPDEKDPEQIYMNTVSLNGMVTSDKNEIPAKLLGQAQKVVQMQFFKKMPEEQAVKTKVVDVVIMNIMHLGHFTEAEFQAEMPSMSVSAAGTDTLQ